ncbi:ribosomal large subunit pseudouridine synthase B [Candidatus Saccharibacteria bacterium]|nr:MAG: ribosomal large subunit pseudouridine synthase B [Candidatus Saccharibacteria bacterium]
MSKQRLNKYIAACLGVSRRKADQLIEQGEIKIDGQTATIGDRVASHNQVEYQGKTLKPKTKQFVLLNKPTGYLSSRASQGGVPTIYELIPKQLHHLKPVGRLDKDSSGLIILTNDGDFAQQMTHPSHYKVKQYLVTIDQPLQPLHINLEDGPSKLSLERQIEGNDKQWIVRMHEGRNRQIRRTFKSLGYTVTKLHRTDFGNYSLGDIERGQWREVNIS